MQPPTLPTHVPSSPQPTLPSQDERTWATFAHLSGLLGFVLPLGNVLGPLVLWLVKKEQLRFVDQEGKEALNFNLSLALYFIVSAVLALVIVGIFLALGLVVFQVVVVILAALRVNRGEPYRYPLCIRFLK